MGCTASKLDDLPAVALCRERCSFLDQAIHHRYAFAEAHVAYLHSLKHVGLSLHHFFNPPDLIININNNNNSVADAAPLNLPTLRKGDPEPSASPPPPAAAITHSNSGSHLHFHSDSEDDDDLASESLHHHSNNISPLNPYGQINYADHETLGSYGGGGAFMNINYSMKNKMTSSVSYEQRPMSSETETLHTMEDSSSSSYYYSNQNQPSSYSSYYGGGMSSFFGSPPLPPTYGSSSPPIGALVSSSSSSSKPPPSPPRASSSWEFLNPFESFDKYYPSYTPLSRNSKEVRDEEGIPELEDVDYRRQGQEIVKEEDEKFMDGGGGNNYAKSVSDVVNDNVVYDDDVLHVVDKKGVENVEKSSSSSGGDRENVAAAAFFKARGVGVGFQFQGDSEVVKEIQVQFERASDSGSEFANILEVGKLPYHRKNAVYQVSSKMLHVITPPLSVVSSHPPKSADEFPSSVEKADPAFLDVDEDVVTRSKTLSSTLQKLYIWEKKLYEEVKVEEKMRVLHERKSKKLKLLDERGAEAHKVDSTRTLVRSLSTKIRIAIQVVDKISVKINKLRDEELWPQLNQFIQGLTRMWKSMLECHRSQCQAIGEARRLDATASLKHFSDAQLEATLQLEHELLNWTLRFSCWFGAQKGYVRGLNNWLLKCLQYVPEETPDGIVPFSPGRIGAPPVFVICNQWSQALESISEKEVVDSMRDFAMSVLQLWERDKLEMCKRMMANKDTERKVKNLEREDQKIQKEFQALDKQLVLVSGDGNGLSVAGHVYQSETSNSGCLQVSLLRIFEAMERFTANSLKAYEELMQRIEEDGLAGEQEKVS